MVANYYKKWNKVNKGDIVDIVAPACGAEKGELKGVVRFIESLGLVARIPKDVIDYKDSVLFSNNDNYRFNHIKDALTNNISKIVWCLRGGYGCARIVESLYKIRKPRKVKIFIGGYLSINLLYETIGNPTPYQPFT